MNDPARNKQLLKSATQVVEAHPKIFMSPKRDPARNIGIVNKLQEIWQRNPDIRLAQLVFNVSGATQPCPEIFCLENDKLLCGLDNFESQEQSGES